MFSVVATVLAAGAAVSAAAVPAAVPKFPSQPVEVPVTPHDTYSSSIGVLGCKINTNQVAYFPMPLDCNNVCLKINNKGRKTTLLRVDQSGGAYDISYDAWNYLVTGHPAQVEPVTGGPVNMTYEFVDPHECAGLSYHGNLPLSAANSMNYLNKCLNEPGSWVSTHYNLFNVNDPICKYGLDEECGLDRNGQPDCGHEVGLPIKSIGMHVLNIQYGTGKPMLAQ